MENINNYIYINDQILYQDDNGNKIITVDSNLLNKKNFIYNKSSFRFKGSNNTVFLHGVVSFKNAFLRFDGSGNVAVLPHNYSLEETEIIFVGNNSLCYLNLPASKRLRLAHITLGSECVFYSGIGTNTNPSDYPNHYYVYEGQNVVFGDKCLVANDIILRTSDNHLFYDIETKKRINTPASIFIGDKCWICQSVYINKNTIIGSGTIIGARSVVGKKIFPSNTLVAGQPGKVLREGIASVGQNIRLFVKEDEERVETAEDLSGFIFNEDENTFDINELDFQLKSARTGTGKLEVVCKTLLANKSHNRFAINKKQ